jgi:RHS repeat-associated protein
MIYAYTGREWDKETGLYYYRARYYDPMEGRFISEDPVPLRNRTNNQLNSYTYAINNPINFNDPSGENIYGNYCGPGGSGIVKDGVDAICLKHDTCFNKTGAIWRDNLPLIGTNDKDKKACMEGCDKQLCDDLRSYIPKTYSEIFGRGAVMGYFRCSP